MCTPKCVKAESHYADFATKSAEFVVDKGRRLYGLCPPKVCEVCKGLCRGLSLCLVTD